MAVIDHFDFFGLQVELHAALSPAVAHPTTQINLFNSGWKILGGGAVVEQGTGVGNLLTAMYPIGATEWEAKANEHIVSSAARMTAYCAAARLTTGPIPDDAYLIVEATSAAPVPHPEVEAALPADFVLVGGGARVNGGAGGGSLLTASRPGTGQSWFAAAKDHFISNPATITAYAIGLRKSLLDQLGSSIVRFEAHSIEPSAAPKVRCGSDERSSLMICGGAETHWNGVGVLLTACGLSPSMTPSGPRPWSWIAQGKDHIGPDPGTITAWSLVLVHHG
jgi:hypothetical protein